MCYKELVYNYILPKKFVIEDLKKIMDKMRNTKISLFDENMKIQTEHLTSPDFSDFDIILSKNQREGFSKIENGRIGDFLLGVPSFIDFLEKFGSNKVTF